MNVSFQIPGADGLLLFFTFLFLGVVIVLGGIMLGTFPFVTDKDGNVLKQINLERPQSYTKLTAFLDKLDPRSVDIIRLNLRLDYIWMAFLYLAALCFGAWLWRHSGCCCWLLTTICSLPLAAWLADILENTFTLAVLRNTTPANARNMAVFSTLKWICVWAYVVGVIYMVGRIVVNFCC